MPLKEFKAISFSCYGTLIDRDSGIFAALRPMMQEGGINLNREEVAARFSEFEAAQSAAMARGKSGAAWRSRITGGWRGVLLHTDRRCDRRRPPWRPLSRK